MTVLIINHLRGLIIIVHLRDAHNKLFWVETGPKADHVTVVPVLNRCFGCTLVTSTQPLQHSWQRDR